MSILILILFIRKPKIVEKTVVVREPAPVQPEVQEISVSEVKEEPKVEEPKEEEEKPKKGKRGRPSKKKVEGVPGEVPEIQINEDK